MSAPDKQQAFPQGDLCSGGNRGGMSLRDWLATQCNVSVYNPAHAFEKRTGRLPRVAELAEYIASIRYIEADAMLAEREKGGDV